MNSTQPPGLLVASLCSVWPWCCLCYCAPLCPSRLVLPFSNTVRLLWSASEAQRSPASQDIRPSPRFLTGRDEGRQTRALLIRTDDPQKNRGNGPWDNLFKVKLRRQWDDVRTGELLFPLFPVLSAQESRPHDDKLKEKPIPGTFCFRTDQRIYHGSSETL